MPKLFANGSNKLCEAQLYLSQDKVDLYSQRMDCLGHIILDEGIHANANKMQKIRDWRQPCNFHNVQFLLFLFLFYIILLIWRQGPWWSFGGWYMRAPPWACKCAWTGNSICDGPHKVTPHMPDTFTVLFVTQSLPQHAHPHVLSPHFPDYPQLIV